MFTGIITAVGEVAAAVDRDGMRHITVMTPAGFLAGVKEGDSVAIDGVCQTVTSLAHDRFTVDAIGSTLARTTFGELQPGRAVNLELALALGDRLGGHLLQGHVDGTGRVLALQQLPEHTLLDVSLPPDVADVTVLHGSVTIDGVSLTVNALPDPGRAQAAIIPYTWEHTNFRRLRVGSAVNLEGDMLGRFVVHYLKQRDGGQ